MERDHTKGITGICTVVLGDRVFGASVNSTDVNSWSFSIKAGQMGQLLTSNTWKAPSDWAAGNVSIRINDVSLQDGIFVLSEKETMQNYGFSTQTGQLVWGPTTSQNYLDNYQDVNGKIVDGRYFSGTMSGITSCYNVTTGALLWKYASYDPYSQIAPSSNFPRRNPAAFVSDGMVYITSYEHRPTDPLIRETPFACVNETTGELIWQITLYSGSYSNNAIMRQHNCYL